jgi:hypothetical protein
MPDTLVSCVSLLERLAREEQQLKQLGLHAQAAGVRVAITILLREKDAKQ